ncbi:redox-sensitive transcriptional activator SoxR [Streptomyces zagrosensis]|uniref:MerR family redox-sensitive transcriptional activator SoxR n=1 Tax=Streptomyces zagrosensis TaxID=1042984 RepID=A0A7W9QAE5_9ACTN|nr:redox-sensitive transcriptional activator SoxR [Streptomyces zagrosensis]MBB5936516.1 MerR family redox-sensitive transcriptional activator SoxR [Streptomyces zagrosensis]
MPPTATLDGHDVEACRLTIGELAARSGLATSALRYYEELGLIHSERTVGGQRRFARATLRRVAFIRAAQQVGLSLEEAGAALARLPEERAPNAAQWNSVAQVWSLRIDAQIADLERLKRRLAGCIGCGCLSLRKCALYNPSDAAADHGSGARYLLGDAPTVSEASSAKAPGAAKAPEVAPAPGVPKSSSQPPAPSSSPVARA